MKSKKDSFLLEKETWERKLRNKKGAEMTIGTIVIIVLALIVLVVLVLGFTGGWTNLWGRITSFFGGSNVDSIVQACQVACSTNSKYDWCDRVRNLRVDAAATTSLELNPPTITQVKANKDGLAIEVKGSCSAFVTKDSYKNMGFTECPGLCP